MKRKRLLICVLACMALTPTFTSCSSDENPVTIQTQLTKSQLIGDWYVGNTRFFSFTENTLTMSDENGELGTFSYYISGNDIYVSEGDQSVKLLSNVSIDENGVLTVNVEVDGVWKTLQLTKGESTATLTRSQLVGDWYNAGMMSLSFTETTVTRYDDEGNHASAAYTIVDNDIYMYDSEMKENGRFLRDVSVNSFGFMTAKMNVDGVWTTLYFMKKDADRADNTIDLSLLYNKTWCTVLADNNNLAKLCFKADGTATAEVDGEKITCTYTYDSKTHILTYSYEGKPAKMKIVALTNTELCAIVYSTDEDDGGVIPVSMVFTAE